LLPNQWYTNWGKVSEKKQANIKKYPKVIFMLN
jgi:hypothetical protein